MAMKTITSYENQRMHCCESKQTITMERVHDARYVYQCNMCTYQDANPANTPYHIEDANGVISILEQDLPTYPTINPPFNVHVVHDTDGETSTCNQYTCQACTRVISEAVKTVEDTLSKQIANESLFQGDQSGRLATQQRIADYMTHLTHPSEPHAPYFMTLYQTNSMEVNVLREFDVRAIGGWFVISLYL
jgi:ribosomal protein L37AE/L43A